MKLDKETFIKHRFWFLLGGFVLVWLIGLTVLLLNASDPIKAKKEAYDSALTGIKGAATKNGGPKNENFYKPWQEYAGKFIHHKDEIWKKAWEVQSDMFTWPSSGQHPSMADVMNNLQSGQDNFAARRDFQTVDYGGEFTELKDSNITGPVEFLGGFTSVMAPYNLKNIPTREECFLVQEDFWVKRDLLYVVRATDDAVAYMQVTPLEKKPEGTIAAYTLRNINWEITLLIEKGKTARDQQISTRSTVKNVHPSHRLQHLANSATGSVVTLGLFQEQWDMVPLVGEPVSYGAVVKFLTKPFALKIDLSDPKEKPFGAMQVFDWYTCPIKRIDLIKIPYQSSRTITTSLKANDFLTKLDAPKDEAPQGGPGGMPAMGGMPGGMPGLGGAPGGMTPPGMTPPGGAPGGGMMGGPGGGMTPGRPGAEAAADTLTPNNEIDRNRYLQAPKGDKDEVEKPCRHMPFAMRLVIDQSHVEDFLVALSNSRLRIQITQVEMNHVFDVKPQAAGASPDEGGDKAGPVGMAPPGPGPRPMPGPGRPLGRGPGMPQFGMGGGMPGMMPGQIRGSMPGMMPGMPGRRRDMGMPTAPLMNMPVMPGMPQLAGLLPRGGEAPAGSQDDPNLVELTVYAITTLYRRPDEPKPAQNSPAPGVPVAAPGPGGNPAAPPPGPGNPPAPGRGGSFAPPGPAVRPNNPAVPSGK